MGLAVKDDGMTVGVFSPKKVPQFFLLEKHRGFRPQPSVYHRWLCNLSQFRRHIWSIWTKIPACPSVCCTTSNAALPGLSKMFFFLQIFMTSRHSVFLISDWVPAPVKTSNCLARLFYRNTVHWPTIMVREDSRGGGRGRNGFFSHFPRIPVKLRPMSKPFSHGWRFLSWLKISLMAGYFLMAEDFCHGWIFFSWLSIFLMAGYFCHVWRFLSWLKIFLMAEDFSYGWIFLSCLKIFVMAEDFSHGWIFSNVWLFFSFLTWFVCLL